MHSTAAHALAQRWYTSGHTDTATPEAEICTEALPGSMGPGFLQQSDSGLTSSKQMAPSDGRLGSCWAGGSCRLGCRLLGLHGWARCCCRLGRRLLWFHGRAGRSGSRLLGCGLGRHGSRGSCRADVKNLSMSAFLMLVKLHSIQQLVLIAAQMQVMPALQRGGHIGTFDVSKHQPTLYKHPRAYDIMCLNKHRGPAKVRGRGCLIE